MTKNSGAIDRKGVAVMKAIQKVGSMALALVMALSLSAPAFAAEGSE